MQTFRYCSTLDSYSFYMLLYSISDSNYGLLRHCDEKTVDHDMIFSHPLGQNRYVPELEVSYPFEMMRAARTHNISFMDEIVRKGPHRILAGWAPGAVRLVVTSAIMGSIIPHLKAFSNSLVMD